MNLFTIDLTKHLTFDMVEQFLRIGDPEADRPQESPLLDFNENIPQDLGDVVTALSNTNGGLVILGVKEKKNGQLAIPDSIVGIPSPQVAVHGKIVNIIWSTVQPRPTYSVGIVPLKISPEKVVAVIRVEEGLAPPYMFIGNQKNKISVRVGDSNRAAGLEHVKALFEKAKSSIAGFEEALGSLGDMYVLRGESRCPTFQHFSWAPSRTLRLRLAQHTERELEAAIRTHFPRDRKSALDITRHAQFTDFDGYNREWNYHRKWRFSDFGAVGFITKVGRTIPLAPAAQREQEIDRVGEWILDALSFLGLARDISDRLGYTGSGQLTHQLSCHRGGQAIQVRTQMPASLGFDSYDEMRGIRLPGSIEVPPLPSRKDWTVNLMQLHTQDITELVADAFLYHIRHIGGSVDWERFVEEVGSLTDRFYPNS